MSSHRSTAFDRDKKLRYSKVEFVSAGMLEGTVPGRRPPGTELARKASFCDKSPTCSDLPAAVAMAQMSIRSRTPSPAPSSSTSSEDEVVFRGRDTTPFTQATAPSTTPTRVTASSGEPAETPVVASLVTGQVVTSAKDTPSKVSPDENIALPGRIASSITAKASSLDQEPTLAHTDSEPESVMDDAFKERLAGNSPWMSNTTPWVSRSKPGIGWLPLKDRPDMDAFFNGDINPAAAAMEDYMQNVKEDLGIKDDSASPHTFAHRPLDFNAEDDWHIEQAGDGWTSDNLQNFDGFSTSSDIMDTVGRILSKRTRKSGVQYLVVYEGSISDDLHWLPASFLNKPEDLKLIEIFEAQSQMMGFATSSESDSEDIDSTLGVTEEHSEDEEENEDGDNDDVEAEMDDEQLARVLQMQADLGLSTDNVVLFGGDEYFKKDLDLRSDLQRFDRPWKKRQNRSKRSQPSFPSASAMADALDADPYNGFDIMDTERPSLRLKKKGRRGQLPVELVHDPEWGEQFQAAWDNDRVKKRLKKAEREELRKQGLLGRKGRGPDLSIKYKDNTSMNEVVEEIRGFMFSDKQTLSLPPMEAGCRAIIHQMVNHMGVTSKSRGEGVARFTVLSKTSRTMRIDDDFFDGLIQKRRFKNRLQASRREMGSRRPIRPVVSYKDGDTVGASAPELGVERIKAACSWRRWAGRKAWLSARLITRASYIPSRTL